MPSLAASKKLEKPLPDGTAMDRNFSEPELNEIIQMSIDANVNMLKYLCKENYDCRYSIKRSLAAVVKHNIIPELCWHGNKQEFEWLLVLLSDGYPGEQELLQLACAGTNGEIRNIADHFYQHVNVMFSYVQKYAGYAVLQPSEYMLSLFPNIAGKLYVYAENRWIHRELSGIGDAFMIIDKEQLNELPSLVSKKIRGY